MTTMVGEANRSHPLRTVQVPPWTCTDEDRTAAIGYHLPVSGVSGAGDCSHYLLGDAALAALRRYLPGNDSAAAAVDEDDSDELDTPVDAFSSDEFRMYDFKVRRCTRVRSHDWTECPFAHPGEKARRRDPRKYHYSGTACPDFRKGSCRRGDACEFAHGVFECWLHPARYRTQPCKDGTSCRRRVCFFAHTPDQLRVLPQQQQHSLKATAAVDSYDGSPFRQQAVESYMASKNHHLLSSSPTSTLLSPPMSPPSESPPVSPNGEALRRGAWPVGASVNDILSPLRRLQLNKVKSMPSSWALQLGNGCGFGSPRGTFGSNAGFKAGFCSLPSTPTASSLANGYAGWFEGLEGVSEEDPVMERVESGRALRAKMFEKLSKESLVERADAGPASPAPDVGWVSELVK